MDYNITNFKFLVTILSSSNEKLLKLSYNSIINQLNHSINYTIIIVINSLNNNYYNDVINEFKNINVEIIQTQSNGKPGMGHNSCIDIFKNKLQYSYLIHIDGDDFLYPYAFHQLQKAISLTKNNNIYPDLLVLQGNDLISWYNNSDSTSDIYLNNSFYLIKQDEYPSNKWLFNKHIVNINPFISSKFITPIRPFLYSRNIFKLNISNFFCNQAFILDDYLFYLHFINIFINKTLNISIINSQHIYLYNDCNINSVQKIYNIEQDYLQIKKYKSLFINIINYFNNDWNVLNLPFTYIYPPFSNIFNDYKIINNSIQISDFPKYINNYNTQSSILFAKNITIQLFHIFIFNIEQFIFNQQYNKAYKLTSTLIDNNITNSQIYTFICISAHFLNKPHIVKLYINFTKPFSNTYTFLQSYFT